MTPLFVTVSDRRCFPGTLAAVNSLLAYHPHADLAVVSSGRFNEPLTDPQVKMLRSAGISVHPHGDFDRPGRVPGAWQLKAYAVEDLGKERDIVILFDADLFFCGGAGDIIEQCRRDGKFRGGKDGDGSLYDASYAPYGFSTPAHNPVYMSTSCCFIPMTPENRRIVSRWSACTDHAMYGPQAEKRFPGHGDQGLLNAVIYAANRAQNIELLPNRLWSQHWTYETDVIEWDEGYLVNRSAGGARQRTVHCGGTAKFWTPEHAARRRCGGQSQRWAYAAFLGHLFLGAASKWDIDPLMVIANESAHLLGEFAHYYQLIRALRPDFGRRWADIGHHWINRCIASAGVHRAMSFAESTSMEQYIRLARTLPPGSTIAEVGSLLGGSIATLALALLDRGNRFVSIESFMGNGDSTVDGYALPSLDQYVANTKTAFPFLNINTIQLPSHVAASDFSDQSLDMVFVDGDHSTESVRRDIAVWKPKVRAGGILAGDDISWKSVRTAVAGALPGFEQGQDVWWVRV